MIEHKFSNETEFVFSNEFIGFTTMPNYIFDDNSITFKAQGIYNQILRYQNCPGHKIYIKSLQACKKDGRDSVAAGLKELINAGYLKREKLTDEKGKIRGYRYIVFMKPCATSDSSSNGKSVNGKPENGKPVTYNKNNKKENNIKDNNTTVPQKPVKKKPVALKSAVVSPQEEIIVKETNIKELSKCQKEEVSAWDIQRLIKAIQIYKELGGLYFKLLKKIYKDGAKSSLTRGKIEANKGIYTHDWDFDELEQLQRERIRQIIKKE